MISYEYYRYGVFTQELHLLDGLSEHELNESSKIHTKQQPFGNVPVVINKLYF